MTSPRVSIGLPVYNGEDYLAETLDSLLAQTFTDFELVISDNASTDATQAICEAFAARDPRVRYYRNTENIGGSKNFARVFELSTAPYFKWAAHDDLCAPSLLEKCVAVLDAHPAVVLCYPRSAFIDERGTIVGEHDDGCHLPYTRRGERILRFLAGSSHYGFPMFGVIRREALVHTCLIAPFVSSDQVMLFQLALQGEFREVPERLFFFRNHAARSIRQAATYADYLKWHDPNRKRLRVQMPRWRLAFEYVRSIFRARLGAREAARCYLAVVKWCRWNRSAMRQDVVMAVRQCVALAFGWQPVREIHASRPAAPAGESRGGSLSTEGSGSGSETGLLRELPEARVAEVHSAPVEEGERSCPR